MLFSDSQGETGDCPTIHATNTAGSALVNLGFRGDNLLFATGSAERMRLTDTGLGIGDNSPSYKLDIAGDYSNPSATAADTAVMGISAAASGSELVIGGEQNGGKVWIQNRHKSVNGYAYELAFQPQGGTASFGGPVNFADQINVNSGAMVVKAANDAAAYVYIQADNNDNNADNWRLSAETDGMFDIQSKESGSWASVVEWSGSDKAMYAKGNVYLSGTTLSLAGTSSVDSYLRFDGGGGDTYLHYNANDMIDVYTGGDIAMRIKDDDVEFNGGVQIDGDLSVDGSFPFMIHASGDWKGTSTEKNLPLRPDGAANATVSTATDLDQQMTWVAPFNTTLRSLYVTTETAVSGCQFKVEVATNYAVYVNGTSTTTTTYTKNFVTASSANISAGLSISKGNAVRLSIDPNSTNVDQFLVTLIFE
jgi:hypothetical protein